MKIFALIFALLFSTSVCAVGSSAGDGDNPRDGAPAANRTTHEGRVIVGIEDDFKNKISRRVYFLQKDRSPDILLLLSEKEGQHLRTGQRIRVTGSFNGKAIDARNSSVETITTVSASAAQTLASPTQIRKVAVILVDISDGTGTVRRVSANCDGTQDKAADFMFGSVSGMRNVEGCFADASFNNLGFGGQSYPGGVTDVYRVQISEIANYANVCNHTAWSNDADTAVGSSLTGYQHKVYVLPPGSSCTWEGLAYVGCSQYTAACKAWIKASVNQECGYIDAFAHELGHNIGMSHSSTDENNDGVLDCEYCDASDIMGYSIPNLRTLNAPHKMQMGWLAGAGVVDASNGGTFTLSALEITNAPYPQALSFATVSGKPYIVSFRAAIGYDDTLPVVGQTNVLAKTSVHRFDTNTGGNTLFIKALADNGTLFDLGNAVTFTQVSHDATSVVMRVTLGTTPPPSCVRASPTVTINPASQSITSAQVVSYGVSVRNNDSAQCDAATFGLSRVVPAGWMSGFALFALTVSPGATGSTTLDLIPQINLTNGTYGFSVTAAEAAHTNVVASGSLVMNAPVCQTSSPSVLVSPSSQTVTSTGASSYSVIVTNNNSAACGVTSFNLTRAIPTNWNGSFSAILLGLSPGTQGQSTFTLTTPATLVNGSYGFTVSAAENGQTGGSASGTLVMNAPVCQNFAPSVLITPSSQTVTSTGATNYSVIVTNNNSAACGVTAFNLARVIPTNWIGSFSASSLVLSPGTQGQSTFTLTTPSTLANSSYGFTVSAAENGQMGGSASGTLVMNAPVCQNFAPSVLVSPSSQTITNTGGVNYSVIVTNNNSAACGTTSFNLARVVPANWGGGFSANSLTLSPGAQGQATFTLTTPTTLANGTYGFTVSAAETGKPAGSASGSLVMNAPVAPVCQAYAPTVVLGPSSQTITSIGWVTYTVTLTNNDSAPCGASSFNFERFIPADWVGNFSTGNVTVSPGGAAQTTFTMYPLNSTPNGTHAFQVGVSANATHAAVSRAGALVVNIDPCYRSRPIVQMSGWKTTGPNAPVTFNVHVINNDGPLCGASTFTFNALVPSGWTGMVSPGSITLAAQGEGDLTFTVNVPSNAPNNLYQVQFSSKSDALHLASWTGTAAVIVQAPVSDTVAPGVPQNLSYQMVRGSTGVALSWNASSDNASGVSYYQILRGGVVVGVTSGTSYTSYAPGGTWVYEVRAVDRAGNVSGSSAQIKLSFLPFSNIISVGGSSPPIATTLRGVGTRARLHPRTTRPLP